MNIAIRQDYRDHSLLQAFCQLAESSDLPTFWLDERGELLSCNEAFRDTLGYEVEEISGLSIQDFNPEVSRLVWRKWWRELRDAGSLTRATEHINAEEQIFPVDLQLTFFDGSQPFCAGQATSRSGEHLRNRLLELLTHRVETLGFDFDFTKNEFRTVGDFSQLGIENNSPDSLTALLEPYCDKENLRTVIELLEQVTGLHQGGEVSIQLHLGEKNSEPQTYLVHVEPQLRFEELIGWYGILAREETSTDTAAPGPDRFDATSRFLLDQVPDLILWVRADGIIKYHNSSATPLLGYDSEELLGKPYWELRESLHESDWESFWTDLREKPRQMHRATYLRSDGKDLEVQVQARMVSAEGEEMLCCFVRDVTEERLRLRRLSMYQYTVENATEMIFWINPDGMLRDCNEVAVETMKLDRETIQEVSLTQIAPKVTERGWDTTWQQVKEAGSMRYRSVMTSRDGRKIDVEVNPTYLRVEDEELLCVFVRDIRKQLIQEREIRQLNKQLTEESAYLQDEISGKHDFNNIITRSKRYRKVLGQVAQVADTNATVLILGETGTGKELLARAIHSLSEREDRPLIKVNCAAIPENLFESELFGHEKGAFTGAHQRKIGRFELADKGTIFLDEVGEMPLDLQAKMLRVLQEGEFERLGDPTTHHTDVRVIAATNRDLEKMVEEGTFREDLYYRLNVFPIVNLPLRQRMDDVPVLVRHFINKYNEKVGRNVNSYTEAGMEKLMQYDFPGNIRELENMVERAIILSKGNKLNIEAVLPSEEKKARQKRGADKFLTFDEMQRTHIIEALRRTGWRVSGEGGAADLLGMNHKTLSSRMRKLNIRRSDFMKI